METTGHSPVETEPHEVVVTPHGAAEAPPHDAAHDDFYAVSNPKYFGLPIGVLLAAGISFIAVSITLLKFLRGAF